MSAVEPEGDWPEQDDGNPERGEPRQWGRLVGIAAALGMSVVFAAAAWYALQRSDMQPGATAEVPLVKAEPGAVKEKPDDPGGLKIPNQDKLVFERITPKPQAPMVEKLAPEPEEPMAKASAPEAPAITDLPADAPANPVNPATAKAMAATEPMAEKAAETTPSPATARTHAAPPAIPAKAEAAKTSKVESLLPAARVAPKSTDSGPKATVSEIKATVSEKSSPTPTAQAKAPPATKAKVSVATPTKAPESATPVTKSAAVKTVKSGYRIQMVAYRKAKLADAAWRRLQKTHADILGGLSGHTARVELGKRGIYYRVQAGFFETAAKARSACVKLKAKRQDCFIVPPQ